MPIKLIAPRKKKDGSPFTRFYYMRGTHLGVFVDESTRCLRPALAKRVIKEREKQIERGRFSEKPGPTFVSAAVSYMNLGGERRPLAKLIAYFGETPITDMGQAEIDQAAVSLFPDASNATRNREVYSPASAVLKRAGRDFRLRRPDGSRGRELTGWLWPEQVNALLTECYRIDAEFGILCEGFYWTGLRRSELIMRFMIDQLRLQDAFAFISRTKNGDPRPVFLPSPFVAALANHPRGLDRPGERVFRFHIGGRLYKMLYSAAEAAGVELPDREAFHVFRHTYGTQMRRVAGVDTKGLVATGAWKSEQAASRYQHTVVTEEARRAGDLPPLSIKRG